MQNEKPVQSREQPNKSRRPDRRQRPTSFLSRHTFVGRRRALRRDSERKGGYYVDRLGGKTWILIGIIVFLSVIDSLFTLNSLKRGFREVNPLMGIAILIGTPVFIAVKYAFTLIGVLILGLHKHFIFVKELTYGLITLYVILNAYHIWLWLS